MEFRISSPDINRISGIRDRRIMERAEPHDLRSRISQQIKVVFIVKAEGLVISDCNFKAFGFLRGLRASTWPWAIAVMSCFFIKLGNPANSININIFYNSIRKPLNILSRNGTLFSDCQAQMPMWNFKMHLSRQISENGNVTDALFPPFEMVLGRDSVKDYSCELHLLALHSEL